MAFNVDDVIDALQLDQLESKMAQALINRKLTKLAADREKLEDKMEQLTALEFHLKRALQKAESRDRSPEQLQLPNIVSLSNDKD